MSPCCPRSRSTWPWDTEPTMDAQPSSSTQPTPPIPFTGTRPVTARFATTTAWVTVTDPTLEALRATGASVLLDAPAIAEASRDWWPLAMAWATEDQVANLAAVIVRPTDTAQVPEIMRVCSTAGIPVTPAAGRSGVVGGSVPLHGGVLLDLCGLVGIRSVDAVHPSPHHRPLAPVDSAVHRRRLARLPRGRSALEPLRQDRGHRRRSRCRPRRRNRTAHRRSRSPVRRARSRPAVRRLGGHPRHHHRRPPPRSTAPGRHPSIGLELPHLRGRRRCLSPDHAARTRSGRPAPLRRRRSRSQLWNRRCCGAAGVRRG